MMERMTDKKAMDAIAEAFNQPGPWNEPRELCEFVGEIMEATGRPVLDNAEEEEPEKPKRIKRRAVVTGNSFCSHPEMRHTVAAYLPTFYEVIGTQYAEDGLPQVVIEGEDNLGWTLDEYVIPRLGSGGFVAKEVTTPQVVHAEFEDVLAALTALDQYEVALRKIAALGDRVETASDGEHMIVCCHPRELETAAAIARAALTPTKEDHG
jgi:hypothetical protein